MAVPYGLLTIMMMITTAREVSALISVVSSPSLRTRGSASSASRRQYFTTKLFNNVNINQSKSSAMPTILNPISKRKIHIGGPKYTELIKEGGWVQHHGTLERIDFKMLSLHQQRGSSSLTNEDKKTDLSLVESFTQPTSVDNENEIGDEWYSITPSVLRASSTSTNATKDTTESAVVMDEKNTEQLRRDLLFVNKPSGLHCVPSRALSDSLAAQIMLSYPGGKPCHRLDRDTSGIVLFGLTKEGHRDVSMQFEARTTSKTYVALVSGHPDKERGLVNLPIGKRKTEEGFNRWTIGGEKPRESITEWIVDKKFTDTETGAIFTRVQLKPLTGRGHQLRLHMKAMGWPILGDTIHGEGGIPLCSSRLCLHAQKLEVDWNGFRFEAESVPPF